MKIQRIFTMFLVCASLVLASSALAQSEDPTPFASPTTLALINGWTNYGYGTNNAQVEKVDGIVRFKGAISTTGTDPVAFYLPSAFRPTHVDYVPVDLCDANKGRLIIYPSGEVYVEAETSFSEAACFTSLDGAWYALGNTGFTSLTLINGWTNTPFSTGVAKVKNVDGVVHFKGAISTSGTNAEPFVLPPAFRPATYVYVPIDLCDATNGRLIIYPNGEVFVQALTSWSDAQCFTSLEGASFALNGSGFTTLSVIDGWTDAPFSTSNAEVKNIDGVVHFKGAIGTSGTNPVPFYLPAAFRPSHYVYVAVDLCDANNGRLIIYPSGEVYVEAETTFSQAACFTSLDGASFVK
jgi:hypothetical protein